MFHCLQAVQNDACHKIMHLAAMSSKVAHSDLESTINTIGRREWHCVSAVQSHSNCGHLGYPILSPIISWSFDTPKHVTVTCLEMWIFTIYIIVVCLWPIKLTLTVFVVLVWLNWILHCIYERMFTSDSLQRAETAPSIPPHFLHWTVVWHLHRFF